MSTKKPSVGRISNSYLRVMSFFRAHWVGTLIILLATLIFFWPIVTRLSSYSEGGDAMFNAWTIARDQHCILHQGCPHYSDANIYFPHKDTMLYSEAQLSAGLVSLPLYWLNNNPIFSYNVLTIVSFFLSGWFMYLLARYLSRGHEYFAILAGLIFEFAPFKMAAVTHLQNLSIFCLPLTVLLILKFFNCAKKRYLILLFLVLLYQFYASWYQMVFMIAALSILLAGTLVIKRIPWRPVLTVALIILVATVATLPLAKDYVRFSKANKATFGIADQTQYSSSLSDYFAPFEGTILGNIYHKSNLPQIKSYDTDSASYHGIIMYILAFTVLFFAFIRRKHNISEQNNYKDIVLFALIGLAGFIISLGPLLKFRANYSYADLADGLKLVIPLPYILVDKILPQMSFIRALGRASVLSLFALCCLMAYLPHYISRASLEEKHRHILYGFIGLVIFIELMPVHLVSMDPAAYHYNLKIPAVYRYIAHHQGVDDIIVLRSDNDYPDAHIPVVRAEDILWSGYHNKNIFNGYSGYTPPEYFAQYADFVDFHPNDIKKLNTEHLKYILVDKLLSTKNPSLVKNVQDSTQNKVYEDKRYVLFKI
jgi:hypothetical protein